MRIIIFFGKNPYYSPQKCIYWYKKACNNNFPPAFNNLAGFYENGECIEQDLSIALELYKKAGQLGDIKGKKNYKILLNQLRKTSYIKTD